MKKNWKIKGLRYPKPRGHHTPKYVKLTSPNMLKLKYALFYNEVPIT